MKWLSATRAVIRNITHLTHIHLKRRLLNTFVGPGQIGKVVSGFNDFFHRREKKNQFPTLCHIPTRFLTNLDDTKELYKEDENRDRL